MIFYLEIDFFFTPLAEWYFPLVEYGTFRKRRMEYPIAEWYFPLA